LIPKEEKSRNTQQKTNHNDVPELFKRVEFSVERYGPDLYPKAMKNNRNCTTYKNGPYRKVTSSTKVLTVNPLDENATATQKVMWRIHTDNQIKREESNLEATYAVE